MISPTTVESDENVDISWTMPIKKGKSPINACQVEIQLSDGSFNEITRYCNCKDKTIFTAGSCSIPHKYLSVDIALSSCQVPKFRVRAQNTQCWGGWSPINTDGARIRGCPNKIELT